ncbi:MAG: 3-phosphoshikimate 1-carboxyvinyltransferase [Sphingobacteriaceae bacterium]|nr:3-phosphoshikimate 1-carboxyvinyltransferase [Cytophagaceae bacterium]
MKNILLHHVTEPFQAEIRLPASKSEANRALILKALTGEKATITNVSEARDTQTMLRLLASTDPVADVLDAGTTMRFLTAYFAVSGQHKTLTGTPRMCERPIGILVDALRTLGADIGCTRKEGYPPLDLRGFSYSGINQLSIRGDVSSQFISALLIIAPTLPDGLTLRLTGELGSRPYIEMTLRQMAAFGVTVQTDWETATLTVPAQTYQPVEFAVENDWSGASYWFAMVALGPEGSELTLPGLKQDSLQGDSIVAELMTLLGVKSEFTGTGFHLRQIPPADAFSYDFTDCPDLAQTVAVVCAAKGIPAQFSGIESLKVKETDRIKALQTELQKFGGDLREVIPNELYDVKPLNYPASSIQQHPASIHTYDDHRMAMAFAPLAMVTDVVIEEPGVVAKSFPGFWEEVGKLVRVETVSS